MLAASSSQMTARTRERYNIISGTKTFSTRSDTLSCRLNGSRIFGRIRSRATYFAAKTITPPRASPRTRNRPAFQLLFVRKLPCFKGGLPELSGVNFGSSYFVLPQPRDYPLCLIVLRAFSAKVGWSSFLTCKPFQRRETWARQTSFGASRGLQHSLTGIEGARSTRSLLEKNRARHRKFNREAALRTNV